MRFLVPKLFHGNPLWNAKSIQLQRYGLLDTKPCSLSLRERPKSRRGFSIWQKNGGLLTFCQRLISQADTNREPWILSLSLLPFLSLSRSHGLQQLAVKVKMSTAFRESGQAQAAWRERKMSLGSGGGYVMPHPASQLLNWQVCIGPWRVKGLLPLGSLGSITHWNHWMPWHYVLPWPHTPPKQWYISHKCRRSKNDNAYSYKHRTSKADDLMFTVNMKPPKSWPKKAQKHNSAFWHDHNCLQNSDIASSPDHRDTNQGYIIYLWPHTPLKPWQSIFSR